MSKLKCWSLAILEVLFGMCALSVIVYQFTGRFDFGFGILSYRFFNIAVSLVVIGYILWGLFKQKSNVLLVAMWFSAFHFAEGVFISFWYKVVIHLLILIIIGWHFVCHKTLRLESEAER
jgi:hypothetical protein